MRNPKITEAFLEVNKLHPTLFEIYNRSSDSYSNYKTLHLKQEYAINLSNFTTCGILPEISTIWYTKENNLYFYNYKSTSYEELLNFSTPVLQVALFRPKPGVFNETIRYALFVGTQRDGMIYAVEADTNTLISTEFSCKLSSSPTCVGVSGSRVFVGCVDGNVYEIHYKFMGILNYKSMSVYTPTNFISRAISGLLRRKGDRVVSISVGTAYLALLSNVLELYSIKDGMSRIRRFDCRKKYLSVQVAEETPLLVSAVSACGNRDFFTLEGRAFTRDHFERLADADALVVASCSDRTAFLKKSNGIAFISLVGLNEDQLLNFKADGFSENFEQINVDKGVREIVVGRRLLVLSTTRVREYEILSAKKLLLNCRTEEIYSIYRNYGELNFVVKYFELLSENENVYRIESFCKNQNIKQFAFYVYAAKQLQPFWRRPLSGLFGGNEGQLGLNQSIKRIRNLSRKLGKEIGDGGGFVDELAQTNCYCEYLAENGIGYKETLEEVMTRENGPFRKRTLEQLLRVFSKNNSVDSFLKRLNNSCPIYLPVEKINNMMGIELLKTGSPHSMRESLKYFTNCSEDVVEQFNAAHFHYGAIYVLRQSIATGRMKYDKLCRLMRRSIRCHGALELGLADSREMLLFPLFEALLSADLSGSCTCCTPTPSQPFSLLQITNGLFERFLRERKSADPAVYNLIWKYQLHQGRKSDAVESLVQLSQRSDLSVETKAEFLETALSITNDQNVRRMIDLYRIQQEMCARKGILVNRLLTADSLLNDYLYDQYDLVLVLFDLLNYRDQKKMKQFYTNFIIKTHHIDVIYELLGKLTRKTNRVGLFIGALVDREVGGGSAGMCRRLIGAGYDQNEVLISVKDILMNNNHPRVKEYLLVELEQIAKKEEYEDVRAYCERVYGVVGSGKI